MARASMIGRLATAAVLVLALGGCASFPGPSSNSDSLFVMLVENPRTTFGGEEGPDLLRFNGPSSFRVVFGLEKLRAYFFRVRPGRYTLQESAAAGSDAARAAIVDVPPAAVFLYPFKLTRVSPGGFILERKLVPVASEDQKAASAFLVDYVDYQKWFGRELIGFGQWPPIPPSPQPQVSFEISSTPAGAEASVDGLGLGTTPLTALLPVGTHTLQLEFPGIAVTRTSINVVEQGRIDVSMPVETWLESPAAGAQQEKISVLLSAFQNMGSAEADNLAGAFPQVIASDLPRDARIALVDEPAVVARAGGIPGRPDFALARERGADLVVSGYYAARAEGLLVYAALYDVRTGIARTSILYTGKAGVSMFDSIDEMATRFIGSFERVLPDLLSHSVKGGSVQVRMVTYERKLTETAIADRRLPYRSSLSLVSGPTPPVGGRVHEPKFPAGLLAFFPVGLAWNYCLGGPYSLTTMAQAAVATGAGTDSGTSYVSSPYIDIPLRFGPEVTLFGSSADFSLGLLAEGRFTQAYFDTGSGGSVYKPILSGAFLLDTSARLYLQPRLSERPSFLSLGFDWFLLGGQMDTDFTNLRPVSLELAILLGYGVRL